MIVLPSRGRPDQLARFFEQSKPQERGLLLLDEDDTGSHGIPLPAKWNCVIGPRRCYTAWANAGFQMFPNEPWYAMWGDDTICSPEGWDTTLAKTAMGDGVVLDGVAWGDDGIQREAGSALPFIGGALVRKIGWLACPSVKHLYCDTIWFQIATELGRGRYVPSVKTEHCHWSTGKQPYDATAQERPIAGDPAAYHQFMRGGGFTETVLRAA